MPAGGVAVPGRFPLAAPLRDDSPVAGDPAGAPAARLGRAALRAEDLEAGALLEVSVMLDTETVPSAEAVTTKGSEGQASRRDGGSGDG